MDEEVKKYYETYEELFASDGWKQLTKELTQTEESINNLSGIKTADDLWFKQGQLDVIRNFLNLPDSVATRKEMVEQEANTENPLED